MLTQNENEEEKKTDKNNRQTEKKGPVQIESKSDRMNGKKMFNKHTHTQTHTPQ